MSFSKLFLCCCISVSMTALSLDSSAFSGIASTKSSKAAKVSPDLMKVFVSPKIEASVDGTTRISGFVKLTTDKNWYVDYRVAARGKPTVVLLNGMTYDTTSWNAFVAELEGKGLGILAFDLDGQGQTLDKAGPVSSKIDFSAQVDHTLVLLDRLQLKTPVHIVGLSYGGGMAIQFASKYPERVATCIMMSPYTEPMSSQDSLIKMNISATRIMFPLNPASDDELYDFFLRQLVYSTYPSTEPSILKSAYRLEATFRLAQGSRTFFAADWAARLPAHKLHLMIAGSDQYIPRETLEKFWASVPETARASKLVVVGSEHKIPEAEPRFSAAWVRYVVEHEPVYSAKSELNGISKTGSVSSTSSAERVNLY